MNLYFLFEGKTERFFYTRFLEYFFGQRLQAVEFADAAQANQYYLVSSAGYPFIYTGSRRGSPGDAALKNAILDINSHPVYDYLIVCLDADNTTVAEREAEFDGYIQQLAGEGIRLNPRCAYQLIVQNRCIETWFLGNRKLFKQNPTSEPLRTYVAYYNVKRNDPEQMGNFDETYTHQDFHLQYLRVMLRERRLNYQKHLPDTVATTDYLEQLVRRAESPEKHIASFAHWLNFCQHLNSQLLADNQS